MSNKYERALNYFKPFSYNTPPQVEKQNVALGLKWALILSEKLFGSLTLICWKGTSAWPYKNRAFPLSSVRRGRTPALTTEIRKARWEMTQQVKWGWCRAQSRVPVSHCYVFFSPLQKLTFLTEALNHKMILHSHSIRDKGLIVILATSITRSPSNFSPKVKWI